MAIEEGEAFEILVVEDNPGDVRLIREAVREARILNRIQVVDDGNMALDYLRHRGGYANRQLPGLIILDLNLPKKDGREVLKEIKQDEALKFIPVIILTSSQADEDIIQAYANHANCYIAKPTDLERFTDVVRKIENFWLTVVRLPPQAVLHARQAP